MRHSLLNFKRKRKQNDAVCIARKFFSVSFEWATFSFNSREEQFNNFLTVFFIDIYIYRNAPFKSVRRNLKVSGSF